MLEIYDFASRWSVKFGDTKSQIDWNKFTKKWKVDFFYNGNALIAFDEVVEK